MTRCFKANLQSQLAIGLFGLGWVLFAAPVAGQSLPNTYRGADRSTVCTGDAAACSQPFGRPAVRGEVRWAAGLLYGEPVVDMRLTWEPGTITHHLKPIYSSADPSLSVAGAGSEAAQQLRLYDARARLSVDMGGARYTLDADLGVPGRPGGEESYNVAGSPDWSRLFRDRDGNFVPADHARWIFDSGAMRTATVGITQARIDTSRFESWWLDKNVERYAGPLRDAIDARLDALGNAFDLPTDDIRAEIAALGPGLSGRALVGKLEDILFKLSPDRIPAKFMGEGPDKLWRLKAYAERIAGSEARLRAATEGLPPMPGSSAAYDTWRDQIGIRLTQDAERLARLQGLQDEADRLAREAEEARRLEEERLAAEEERLRQEEEWREQQEWEEQSEGFDWGTALSEAFASTDWGYGSGMGSDTGFTVPGYYYHGIYIGDSSSSGSDSDEHPCIDERDAYHAVVDGFNARVKGGLSDSEARDLYESTSPSEVSARTAFSECLAANPD